jgi:chemotaxis-related protein WspD
LVSVALERVLWTERAAPTAPSPSRTALARMLVLSSGESRFVARVDEVHGIRRVARDELLSPPATLTKSTAAYTSAVFPWQSRSVGCLDVQLLFRTLAQSLS